VTKKRATGSDHYDLVVIGAGQGGGPLAGAFARAGRRVALVERLHVGGTCINVGCSPTKTIIASARAAHVASRSGEYGVYGCDRDSGDIGTDLRRVRDRKQQIVESFRSGSEHTLAKAGVELVRGHARFVGPRRVEVFQSPAINDDAGAASNRLLTAETIVINTGLRAAIPSIPGLASAPYLTSTTMLELAELPTRLVVAGGGYVGVEFAQAYRRFGSEVTIVERKHQLLPDEDEDVANAVSSILQEDGIEVLLSAETMRIERHADGVQLVWHDASGAEAGRVRQERVVSGSHLLIATGRRPNTDDLGLDAAGIEVDGRGYIRVNDRLETTAADIYAIGDVKGPPAFTHISYDDFRILRTNLLEGGSATTNGRLVPYAVFIDPQLGATGMTEREAREAGRPVRIAKLPMASVARALEVDETRGFMKAIVDAETNQILGARVLGLEGGEIAALFHVAMMGKLPYTALRDGIFSHPTLAESLNNLFTAMDRE
jgi:pyruvate/2-oxoglutarate dehydrogenase complex dihydrolipoamide dehydrogenase (E3) component